MTGRPFTCAQCGGQFLTDRSDDEAMDEALALFHAEDLAEGFGEVCDDCFEKLTAWARENAPELLRGQR